MKPETSCEAFLDEILSGRPPAAELAAHLEKCPACRETAQTVGALKARGGVYPQSLLGPLENRIMENCLPPSAGPSAGWAIPKVIARSAAVVLLAVGIGSGVYLSRSRPSSDNGKDSKPPAVIIESTPAVSPSKAPEGTVEGNSASATVVAEPENQASSVPNASGSLLPGDQEFPQD